MENTNYYRKSVDELTFTDDGMFQAVLHDPKICAELIEKLLHVKVNHVDYPKLEKPIAPYYSSKGVRLDVYLKDNNKVIDVEMQSSPQEALGKRTRYYQSMVDIDSLLKGQDYTELKDSYILFICKTDPFEDKDKNHYDLPCYTFRNICTENPNVELDDKSLKVIYNASAYKKESNEKIRGFLQYVYTNDPGEDDFSKRLSKMVERIKNEDKFRREYAAMNLHDRDIQRAAKREGIAEGISVGIKQGTQQKAIENAMNFLRMKVLTMEQIAQGTGLSVEEVNKLAKEIL
jgi:predicted transposase/invertase (TIGR01784 family)